MANLNRIAKSGNDWNQYHLEAYNIHLQFENRTTFFGKSNLPPPQIDEEILTTLEAEDMLSDHNAELIHLLNLAMYPVSAGETALNDFTVELLRQLSYVKRNRIAHTQKDIPHLVCGEWRHTRNDICLLDCLNDWEILLLIQEIKKLKIEDSLNPEAPLIAKAIGAFDQNNRVRLEKGKAIMESKACGSHKSSGFPYSLAIQIMPGILMGGTIPTFYKIPVTTNLVYNILQGTYPSEPTIVSVHRLNLPSQTYGMKPLDNRQRVLCCFEAFKNIIGI